MSNYRIRQYASISSIRGAQDALVKYGPLLIAFPVYRNSPQIWKPKRVGDEMVGGHAMTVVGYNSEGFIIRNSWGKTWNGDGCVIYPYSDWGCHWEIWSSIDEDSEENNEDADLRTVSRQLLKLIQSCCPCLRK